MARIAMVESESRSAPAPVVAPPEPAALAAAIVDLCSMTRLICNRLAKRMPCPESDELFILADRKTRGIEAALSGK